MKKWRIFPKIHYHNYKKSFPNLGDCFTKWIDIQRFWGGRIIYFHIKHYCLELDFRRDWVADMVEGIK